MQQSYIDRFISKDKKVRAFFVDSTSIANYARILHGDNLYSITILSKLMSLGLILSQMLKSKEDKLTLQLLGDGPLKHAIVTSNFEGTVRGYCSYPQVEINNNNINVSLLDTIGHGSLTIIKDMGLKQPFVSSVEINSPALSKVSEEYFTLSDQTKTYVDLFCKCKDDGEVLNSSAFIIQLLPNCDIKKEQSLDESFYKNYNLEKLYNKSIDIHSILEDDFDITQTRICNWLCNCSFERGKEVLQTLNENELIQMINDSKNIDVSCDFCGKKYTYTKTDLENVLSNKRKLENK